MKYLQIRITVHKHTLSLYYPGKGKPVAILDIIVYIKLKKRNNKLSDKVAMLFRSFITCSNK